jgi:predicted amidohydrolase
VALTICWDLGLPEVAREAAITGADLILAPAARREPWGFQYELCCAARALDSGVYLASANHSSEPTPRPATTPLDTSIVPTDYVPRSQPKRPA